MRGVTNVMRHLGMVSSAVELTGTALELVGAGNLDIMITAPCAGHFRSEVTLMEAVVSGQRIGAVYDLGGREVAPLYANRDGVVICLRRLHRVDCGDGVCHITGLMGSRNGR